MSNSSKCFWDDELVEKPLKPIHEKISEPLEIKSKKSDESQGIYIEQKGDNHQKNKKKIKSTEAYQPEQEVLKKNNKKDFILIFFVVIVLIVGIVLGTVFIYDSGNRKIYSYIDSGSYAVAYKEIYLLHENGENVDSLVKKYIEACMDDREYKRAVYSLELLSDEGFAQNSEKLSRMVEQIHSSGKTNLAEEASLILENHNVK